MYVKVLIFLKLKITIYYFKMAQEGGIILTPKSTISFS